MLPDTVSGAYSEYVNGLDKWIRRVVDRGLPHHETIQIIKDSISRNNQSNIDFYRGMIRESESSEQYSDSERYKTNEKVYHELGK